MLIGAALVISISSYRSKLAKESPRLDAPAAASVLKHSTLRQDDSLDQWIVNFSTSTARGSIDMEQGIRLAKERRRILKELIISDPERAVASAIPENKRRGLPPAILEELESLVAGRGFFGVLPSPECSGCRAGGAHSPDHGSKRQFEAVVDGVVYEAHVYGRRRTYLSQENAPLFGIAINDHLALHEDPVQLIPAEGDVPSRMRIGSQVIAGVSVGEFAATLEREIGSARGETADYVSNGVEITPPATANPPTEPYPAGIEKRYGPKAVLFFRVVPSDAAEWTSPTSQTSLDNDLSKHSEFFFRNSYRKTWFGPKEIASGQIIPRSLATPVLRLPKTRQLYVDSLGALQTDARAALRALGGDWAVGGKFDYAKFDYHVALSNVNILGFNGGRAFLGGNFSALTSGLGGAVLSHEFGHNWDLGHANMWKTTDGLPRSPTGKIDEYGDDLDTMGVSSFNNEFTALNKELAGFLNEADGDTIMTVTSGTYRIFDHTEIDSDRPDTRLRLLKLPLRYPIVSRYYLGISYRNLENETSARANWHRNAAEIHYFTSGETQRLDTTPQSGPGKDDAGLWVGRTYSEGPEVDLNNLSLDVHITPLGTGSITSQGKIQAYMDVRVNFGSFSSNRAPTAAITSSPAVIAPGQLVNLSGSASDPDGDELSWAWDFGVEGLSTTRTANQSISFAETGYYWVTADVSDMKGGVTKVGKWINVGNLQPSEPLLSPAVLPGLEYTYYEGNFTSMPVFSNLPPVKSGVVGQFSLSPATAADQFGLQFSGYLTVPADDYYTFDILSNDGSRLWIGDDVVVNNNRKNQGSSDQQWAGTRFLRQGVHPIRLDFYHYNKTQRLSVRWKRNGGALEPIPQAVLSHAVSTELTYEEWAEAEFAGLPSSDVAEISLPDRDPDGDGLSNLFEYVLGSGSPLVFQNERPLEVTYLSSPPRLSLSYFKNLRAKNWDVVCEWSNDLKVWEPVPTSWDSVSAGSNRVKMRSSVVASDPSQQFVRLSIGPVSP